MRRMLIVVCLLGSQGIIARAGNLPRIEGPAAGVTMVMDDNSTWGGSSMGTTHQHQPSYQAMKIINLAGMPPDVLKRAREARLRVYFAIQDYSWHDVKTPNGLDESFEVIVNAKVHTYRTDGGFIAKARQHEAIKWAWQDFVIPVGELVPGENRFIIKKAEGPKGPKYDDYIYVGIDNSVSHRNSLMSNDGGKTWSNEKLNAIGATGEYMVRLVLIEKELAAHIVWRPGKTGGLDDPNKIIRYADTQAALLTEDGLTLKDANAQAVLELDPSALDRTVPPTVMVEVAGATLPRVEWQDADGKPLRAQVSQTDNSITSQLLRSRIPCVQLVLRGVAGAVVDIRAVKLDSTLAYLPDAQAINMCPRISAPRGAPANRIAACKIQEKEVILENPHLRCRFTTGQRLHLASLYNEYSASEMVRDASATPLFLVEIGGKRYSATKDFACRAVNPLGDGKQGFHAELLLQEHSLRGDLVVTVDAEGLRMGMTVANEGAKPLDFKLAFPVLAGLVASDDPASDYYFYPWGGGIIADAPATVRRGYGDHAALYQVMDIFSPRLGAGLLVRADDTDGRYKVLALRKVVPGRAEVNSDLAETPTADEYKWTNPLKPVPGVSIAFEYLRRTREPGRSFSPADAVIETHPGDWHEAMRRYAAWAHKVWKFRPYPSRLDDVVNMVGAGWAKDVLFKDGQYRTDFIKPETNCIELMSWWDWSPLGPWRTPFDKIEEKLGPAVAKMWAPYFVKDPVTGQTMFGNQPGDYDGYNQRFGGLPAFRKAVQTYKDMGSMVTLYTDPIRCDDNTKMGEKYGKLWTVIKPDGKPVNAYNQWTMCHDVAEYRQWVADTMKRVMRETGADGLRLDEYGHKGWACFNMLHRHTFAEPGCQEWMRCITETCRLVHAAMDEVNPKLILTTEHPGYDFLMQFLDGCITYDLTVQATELRPLECNTQRFYFPECKAYELDHRGADTKHEKRFWNAVASFGAYYPYAMYTILRENNDAFHGRDVEPLVPTLVERVYANRFAASKKVITTLYNARGYTVNEPVVQAVDDTTAHYFDLLACKELPVANVNGKGAISLKIPRSRTACVAQLPRAISARWEGEKLIVTVAPGKAGPLQVVIASQDGKALATTEARAGENALAIPVPPANEKPLPPACVKLLRGGYLVDAVEAPAK